MAALLVVKLGNPMAARKVVPMAAQLAAQWVATSVLLWADLKEL